MSKDTKGVRQVLLDFGRAWHKAMPSAVGGLREARKAEAALQEIMLGMLPEERVKTGEKNYADYDYENPRHRYVTGVDVGWNQALKTIKQNIRGGFNNG